MSPEELSTLLAELAEIPCLYDSYDTGIIYLGYPIWPSYRAYERDPESSWTLPGEIEKRQ